MNPLSKPIEEWIAIDNDEVASDFAPSFIEFHNGEYKTNLTKAQMTTFDFSVVLGIPRDEVGIRFSKFYKTDLFRLIKPVKGAVKGIALLNEAGRKPIIVSSRPEEIHAITRCQIKNNFNGGFHEIYFSKHLYLKGAGLAKEEICLKNKAHTLFEDCLDYGVPAAKEGIEVILFDQPWNQCGKIDGIHRVGSWEKEDWWEEAVDYVLNK